MRAPDIAIVGLIVLINIYWTFYDFVLCRIYHWTSITDQIRHYLHETVLGPFIFGLLVAIPAIFLYHIFQTFAKQR